VARFRWSRTIWFECPLFDDFDVVDVTDVEPVSHLAQALVRPVEVARVQSEEVAVDRDHLADPADPGIVTRKMTIWIRHDERDWAVAVLFCRHFRHRLLRPPPLVVAVVLFANLRECGLRRARVR